MGCDIHMYSEMKRHDFDDGKKEKGVWLSTGRWFQVLTKDYDTGEVSSYFNFDYDDGVYDCTRNYILFAALADVRNRNRGISPISYPKGLPDDVSLPIKNLSDRWDGDGHSHSYLTLKELLEYDWDKEIKLFYFKTTEYEAVQEYGDKIVSMENTHSGVNVTILAPIRNAVLHFMDAIDTMKSWLVDISSATSPSQVTTEDDIRIVFWFDN